MLDEIEKTQHKIDELEVEIENVSTQIVIEKHDASNTVGDFTDHHAVHIQHLEEQKESNIKETCWP